MGAPASVVCGKCDAEIRNLLGSQARSAVCDSCGSVMDLTQLGCPVVGEATGNFLRRKLIPLGSRGHFRGHEWTVVGLLLRSDDSTIYKWHEYLLHCPGQARRWLVEYDGHWSYLVETKGRPTSHESSCSYEGRKYERFLVGKSKTLAASGCFPWLIEFGHVTDVVDYVSPPELLSREADGDEVVWSLGEYVAFSDVQRAFVPGKPFQEPRGRAPNQPSPYKSVLRTLWWGFFIGTVLLLITHGLTASNAVDVVLMDQSFTFLQNQPNMTFSVIPMEGARFAPRTTTLSLASTGADELVIKGSLHYTDNGFTDLFSLILPQAQLDAAPGSVRQASKSISVQDGRPMKIIFTVDGPAKSDVSFSLSLKGRSHELNANLVTAIILLAAVPFVATILHSSFETERWASSDLPDDQDSKE